MTGTLEPLHIPRAQTGTGVSHSQHTHTRKKNKKTKLGRDFGKNADEWTGRVEISQEEIPDSR